MVTRGFRRARRAAAAFIQGGNWEDGFVSARPVTERDLV